MKRLLTERNFIHATAGCIFEMSPYHYEEIGDIINAVSDFVKNKRLLGFLRYCVIYIAEKISFLNHSSRVRVC